MELAFDRDNLPGLSKSIKHTIRIEDPLFAPIHNSLKEALRKLPNGKNHRADGFYFLHRVFGDGI